jgi:hypothetical protein
MKQIKRVLPFAMLLGALVTILGLFGFSNSTDVQKGDTDYILIDVYEVPTYEKKGIHIHYGPGNTKVIPFKEFRTEFHDDNGELLIKTLNDLKKEGYVVDKMSSGKATSGMITKFLLVKE